MSLTDTVTAAGRRAEYVRKRLWDDTTLAAQLRLHRESLAPHSVAVVDRLGERTRTYVELDDDSDALARLLLGLHVRPGEVIAAQLPNWYEAVVTALAVFKIGAVLNPMLPVYRISEIAHMLRVGRTRVLVSPDEYRGFDYIEMARALKEQGPLETHIVVGGTPAAEESFYGLLAAHRSGPPVHIGQVADAVSEIIFTSGTESTPKAVMHTEQTTNFGVRAMFTALAMLPSDVVWMPSPVGHATGLNCGVRLAVFKGLKLVLQDRWMASEAAALVETQGCTYTLAATTFLSDLIGAAEGGAHDLSCLRLFNCGGAPIPRQLVNKAADLGIQVLRLYGATEAPGATWNRPSSPVEKRITTVGSPGTELEFAL